MFNQSADSLADVMEEMRPKDRVVRQLRDWRLDPNQVAFVVVRATGPEPEVSPVHDESVLDRSDFIPGDNPFHLSAAKAVAVRKARGRQWFPKREPTDDRQPADQPRRVYRLDGKQTNLALGAFRHVCWDKHP